MGHTPAIQQKGVEIRNDGVLLNGDLALPDTAQALVLFAHGSGSSRLSPRNRAVASELNRAGLATLLFDLLTPEEQQIDQLTGELRFDIGLLSERLTGAIDWTAQQADIRRLPLGLFGASTGAAAALVAAARRSEQVAAVVSRGGRPDLAAEALSQVKAPTLLIVGSRDPAVLEMNRSAAALLTATQHIEIVAGATHLFEEPGTLEEVTRLARDWFVRYLVEEQGQEA